MWNLVLWTAVSLGAESVWVEGEDATEVLDILLSNYIPPAQEQTLDGQGRVLVPPEHREHAGLVKEVVFTGDIRKFRLWSVDEWRRFRDYTAGNKAKIGSLRGLRL